MSPWAIPRADRALVGAARRGGPSPAGVPPRWRRHGPCLHCGLPILTEASMNRLFPTALVAAVVALGASAQAQVLRWASQGDPQTMDPHSQNESMTNMMNGQVYERLVSRDRQLNIVPGLATSWEQVSPTLWRFKLRPNVKFHDGSPLTADDVVYSIVRGQQPTSQINNY